MEFEPLVTAGNAVTFGLITALIGIGLKSIRLSAKVSEDLHTLKEVDHVKRLEFEALRNKVERIAEDVARTRGALQRHMDMDGDRTEGG